MNSYKLLVTRKLNDDIAESEEMAKAITKALERFNAHDWGELDPEDIEANNRDLEERAGHVLAKYPTPKGYIYINLTFNEPSMNSDIAVLMYPSEY